MKSRTLAIVMMCAASLIFADVASAATVLTRSFGRGATDALTGGEVSLLQKILAQDKSVYPEGLVTGTFGPATERAVQNWQKKNRIVTSGTPATTGYGWVGAKTRAGLNAKAGSAITKPSSSASGGTKGTPGIGMISRSFGYGASDTETGGDVSTLQRMLAQDKTIYPEGLVTGTFGPATLSALKRFQCQKSIVCQGTPATTGYGWVGAKTRTALNENASITMTVATPPPAPIDPAITGALSVKASPNLTSTYSLAKAITLTNTITSSFIGAGNGLTVTFTQTGAPQGITVPKTLSCTTPCSIENKVGIASGMKEGVYPITIMAVAGKEKAVGTYTITIGAPTAYQFDMTNSGDIIVKKSLSGAVSGSNSFDIRTTAGEPKPVTITQTTGESGITVKDLGACTPPCTRSNSVSVGFDVISGRYNVVATGRAADGTTRTSAYNVIVNANEKFGFHISNQADPDKSITVTQPVGQSITNYIPLKFILDGGSPSMARIELPRTFPKGISASISGCLLPCSPTLTVTVSPEAEVGSDSIRINAEADYVDPVTQELKTLSKSYSQRIVVIAGDMGTVQ